MNELKPKDRVICKTWMYENRTGRKLETFQEYEAEVVEVRKMTAIVVPINPLDGKPKQTGPRPVKKELIRRKESA